MCRDTVFTIIVIRRMYRDTIFMIEIYPDMYHDTVSLSVSSGFVLRSAFLRLHARFSVSLVCVGDPHTSVFHEVSPQDSVKSVQCRNESIGRHPVSRVVQRTLESTQLSLLVPTLLPVLLTKLEIWNSRGMCKAVFRGMKVNEFADLTISEFVSEYPDENPNVVWSGRKLMNSSTNDSIHDSCFQSSDEGPSLSLV